MASNPEQNIVNFEKLSKAALCRYQAYFNIPFNPGDDHLEKIPSHFYEQFFVDEKLLLQNFFGLAKDSNNEDITKRKSNRVKEKNSKKDYQKMCYN